MTIHTSLLSSVRIMLLIAFAHAGAAETAEEQSEREVIALVIQAQLDAFQRDDRTEAFYHASPGVKRSFVTADNFIEMVRTQYEPVYNPQSVTFLNLEKSGPYRVQHILVIGPNGYGWDAFYFMEKQSDGRWTIAGVYLYQRSDTPA